MTAARVLAVDGGQSASGCATRPVARRVEVEGVSRWRRHRRGRRDAVAEGWRRGRLRRRRSRRARAHDGARPMPPAACACARLVGAAIGAPEVWVADDAVTAHAGALSLGWGVSVVAGTGVACLARPAGRRGAHHRRPRLPAGRRGWRVLDRARRAAGRAARPARAVGSRPRSPRRRSTASGAGRPPRAPPRRPARRERHRPVRAGRARGRRGGRRRRGRGSWPTPRGSCSASRGPASSADGQPRHGRPGRRRWARSCSPGRCSARRLEARARGRAARPAVRRAHRGRVRRSMAPWRSVSPAIPAAIATSSTPGTKGPPHDRTSRLRRPALPRGSRGPARRLATRSGRASTPPRTSSPMRSPRGGTVHAFGTGHSHMLAEELFYRAGGLVRVRPILFEGLMLHAGAELSTRLERLPGLAEALLEQHPMAAGDVADRRLELGRQRRRLVAGAARPRSVACPSSRSSAVPTRRPTRAPRGRRSRASTRSPTWSSTTAARRATRRSRWPGLRRRVGPTSTVVGAAALNAIVAEAVERLVARGVAPDVFTSSNIEGGDAANARLAPPRGRAMSRSPVADPRSPSAASSRGSTATRGRTRSGSSSSRSSPRAA